MAQRRAANFTYRYGPAYQDTCERDQRVIQDTSLPDSITEINNPRRPSNDTCFTTKSCLIARNCDPCPAEVAPYEAAGRADARGDHAVGSSGRGDASTHPRQSRIGRLADLLT